MRKKRTRGQQTREKQDATAVPEMKLGVPRFPDKLPREMASHWLQTRATVSTYLGEDGEDGDAGVAANHGHVGAPGVQTLGVRNELEGGGSKCFKVEIICSTWGGS